MKVNLVVATGVHQGKVIPVPGTQFLIGRDPECQLRPASQAVSKQHCAILVRGEQVFVKDYGSTNGTFLNDEQLPANSELELKSGVRLRMGPLDFTVQLVPEGKPSDSTPLPEALKSADTTPAQSLKAAVGAETPAARQPVPAAGKPGSSAVQKPVPKPAPKPVPEDADAAAAMLLGFDDDDPPRVPEGSTVFEMPVVNGENAGEAKSGEAPKKGSVPTREETSNAASDILRRYMRRPR